MLALAAPCVAGWASISQAVWGVQLADIQAQFTGGFSSAATLSSPESQLGYLWTMPTDSADLSGLGGGITWAWDPDLCNSMKSAFYQELVPGVKCEDLRAAVRRAFSAWSSECSPVWLRVGAGLAPNTPLLPRHRQPCSHFLR